MPENIVKYFGLALGCMVVACTLMGCEAVPPIPDPDDNDVGSPTRPDNIVPTVSAPATVEAIEGELFSIDASGSNDPDGSIESFLWTLEDGSTATGAIAEFVFSTTGTFEVLLTITDNDGSTSSETVRVNVTAPQQTFDLTVLVEPLHAAEVTLDPPGGTYLEGDMVTITVQAATGFEFDGYQDDLLPAANPTTITVDGDTTVIALMSSVQVAINTQVSPTDSGTVMLDPPGGLYDFGTEVSLHAEADTGFRFDGYVDEDGITVSTSNPYVVTATEDATVTAMFRRLPPPPQPVATFELQTTVSPAIGGTIEIFPARPVYDNGTVVTLNAIAAEAFVFAQYTGDASDTNPITTITMNEDKAVSAEFIWQPALANPANILASGFVGKNVSEFDRFDGSLLGEIVTAGSGGLSLAGGIEIGPSGDIYVVNVGLLTTTSVHRYDGDDGTWVEEFATGLDVIGFITCRFGPNGNLFVANNSTDAIEEYDGASGAFVQEFVPAGGGVLDNPIGMTFGTNGNLYVVSQNSNTIHEFDGATGGPIQTVSDLGAAGFSVPVDLLFGDDGLLYVSTSGNSNVLRIDPGTGQAVEFVTEGSGGLDKPGGLAFHADTRNLLVVSQETNSILEYDGTTGAFLKTFATGNAGDNLFFLAVRNR